MVSYRQSFNNSCGAASLMCAALELGVNTIPNKPAVHPLWTGSHTIHERGDLTSEARIYAVTSGSPGAPSNQSGYSLPSRIGFTAKELGLTTIAFVPRSIVGNLLLFLYGSEKIDAERVGMLLKREAAPRLADRQRLLRILRVGEASSWRPSTGLHYVMERPEGSIMDPAVGQNFPNLDMAIAAHRTNGVSYQDTGLAILVV